jgi:hypothetical protein
MSPAPTLMQIKVGKQPTAPPPFEQYAASASRAFDPPASHHLAIAATSHTLRSKVDTAALTLRSQL